MSPKSELWAFIVEIVTHLLDHQLQLELLLHPGDALHSVPDLLHGRGVVTHLRRVLISWVQISVHRTNESTGVLLRVIRSVQVY